MSYARGIWIENGDQTEGVVPINWIIAGRLYWPPGLSVVMHYKRLSNPDISKWKSFKYLSTKCEGDEETCENYNFVTTQEENSTSEESEESDLEKSEEETVTVPEFPNVPLIQATSKRIVATPPSSFPKKKKIQTPQSSDGETVLKKPKRIVLPSQRNRVTSTPLAKVTSTPLAKRKHGLTYPLSDEKFQKAVINLLSEISDKLDGLQLSSSNLQPASKAHFQINHIHSIEELEELNQELADETNYTSFVAQLSRIGGKPLKTNVTNILQRFMPNSTQATCNMHGNGEKFGLEKTNIYQAVIDAVFFNYKEATITQIREAIMSQLKHAPRRSNGGGSKKQATKAAEEAM